MYFNPFGNPDDGFEGAEGESAGISHANKILQGLLSELPGKARFLVEKIEREIKGLQEQTADEAGRIREEAERQIAELERKMEGKRSALYEHVLEQLEPLQKDLFRAGELGPALATFVQIQALKTRAENVLPDPRNLTRHHQVGKTFLFRVTGCIDGPVWGTDIYTSDSMLAAAAVHSGALEDGEEGVVRVSMVDMSGLPVRGSMRNGVMTMDWGPYPIGFRVSRG